MLQSIEDSTLTIISSNNMTTLKIDPLIHVWIKRVSIDVYKSLNDSCPSPLRNIFVRFKHAKDTRGNGSRLILPKVKTEVGRKAFAFQGALIFNGLPASIRDERYFLTFKRKIKNLRF